MAITKTAINYSSTAIQTFLQGCAPDFFASVEISGSDILCKDSDGNTVYKCTPSTSGDTGNWGHYGYADASNSVSVTTGYLGVKTAYKTVKGIMLICNNSAAVIISKTNNDEFCVLIPDPSQAAATALANPYQVVAWGDETPLTDTVNSGYNSAVWNQTVFCPITTHATFGEPSYFADAFFTPISQYRTESIIIIEGVYYITNGYVALRDE